RAALRAVRLRMLDMNALMTLAATGAICTRDYLEAATAMVLFGVSLWLESYSLHRARRAVRSLVELSPTLAHRFEADVVRDVAAADVQPGDRLLVKPGERVPADGQIAEGRSWLNEAPLTGESLPVEKLAGDRVFAGSINGEGSLVMVAELPAAESTLAHVARLVDQAQQSRSPTERFIDRFARYYTPVVIAAAIVLAGVPPLIAQWGVEWAATQPAGQWLHRGLVLLVVACPCALVISTPVTIVCGLHAAARRGMLVKGGEFLERAAMIDALAFDKTGTLTRGQAEVVRIEPTDGVRAEELLCVAAALESRSEHPVAQAIMAAARQASVSAPHADEVAALRGLGVRGVVDSETYFAGNWQLFCQPPLAADGAAGPSVPIAELHEKLAREATATIILVGSARRFLGALAIADRPRDDATAAIDELMRLGISPLIMLSGDREEVARQVAGDLRLDEFRAGLLPSDKLDEIRRLTQIHPRMAMVGDGINDAPALAASWIGIAFGTQSSDTALETADVVVMSSRLTAIGQLIRLGRRCRRVLGQNITAALALKAIVLLAAVFGPAELARLWLAVAADVGATLLVVANGMRLLRAECGVRNAE
ncbi:MAG TPA: cation-translocating P-type ATPase, partial [Pirellulales bacterium]|nr:cation-translocating P-type ATPase [Pirellulales bacterium]